MTAKPPSDDSQLPQLRRFRFLPDDPKVAREIGPDGRLLDPTEASHDAPGTTEDDSQVHLRESEQLLAALETPPAPTPPTSQDDIRAVRSAAPSTAERRSGADEPRPPVAAASSQRAGRAKSWPFLAAGVVLAVLIAGVVWLVTRPGDEQGTDQEGAAHEPSASELPAAEWAEDMCTELSEFQTTAMPLRAETAKASASSAATEQNVDQLRRQASELLTDLAAELQEVGMPTDSTDAAGVHTTVLSAVNAAASSANPSISPSPADSDITPAEAATEVLSALDRPLVVFQQAVSDLAEESRDEISSAPACGSLL